MFTALSATSQTLKNFLSKSLSAVLDDFNNGAQEVCLNNPKEMPQKDGLSLWLYRIARDDQTLNAPPERIDATKLRRTSLPFRLHYLITAVVKTSDGSNTDTEQKILGRVLQALHDHPIVRGLDLQGDLQGTGVELAVRLEPLTLEEMTKIWDALDGPYQLSISYEVSVVYIESGLQPEHIKDVETVLSEYGVIVSSERM